MSSTNDSWRGAHRGLVMPTVVGAIWRLGMLVVDKWHQPLLLNDSLYYSAQARQLVRVGVLLRRAPQQHRAVLAVIGDEGPRRVRAEHLDLRLPR